MTDVGIGPETVLAGRYRLLEPLGHGGMATVFRATDERLGRDVAVKVFRRDVAEAVDLQRIQRETRLLAAISSPYVVTVFDAVESDLPGLAYLVLELVDGCDLRTLLEKPRRPTAEFVRRIVADIAMALEALHSQGVVHRDVKPANVLVLAGANRRPTSIAAKLSDFGIAQSVDSTRLTATNFILGTAAYLSPEQVRGSKLRPASDVYSLGLMLIESLTGKPAFQGPVAESAAARLARPPQLPRNASPALADLLSRMTAIDPGERPRAGEVATALHELAGGMTTPRGATGRTERAGVVRSAPAMPLGTAAMDAGQATALAERPRRRRTDTAPVALAAGAAAVGIAATGAEGAAAAPQAAAQARLPQDEQPTGRLATGRLATDGAAPQAPAGGTDDVDDGVAFLQHELPAEAIAVPAGEHRASRLRRHPRTAMLATLAGCALIVGAGSVALAATGGPFLAGAEERTPAPVAALADPPGGGIGAGDVSAAGQQRVEARLRTEDLITGIGAREAGLDTTPPLKPIETAEPRPRATASTSTATRSSSTPSTPTRTAAPEPEPTRTATPTPEPTRTTEPPTPTPTPTETATPTPTPEPTTPAPEPTTPDPPTPTPSGTTSTGTGGGNGTPTDGATNGTGSTDAAPAGASTSGAGSSGKGSSGKGSSGKGHGGTGSGKDR